MQPAANTRGNKKHKVVKLPCGPKILKFYLVPCLFQYMLLGDKPSLPHLFRSLLPGAVSSWPNLLQSLLPGMVLHCPAG